MKCVEYLRRAAVTRLGYGGIWNESLTTKRSRSYWQELAHFDVQRLRFCGTLLYCAVCECRPTETTSEMRTTATRSWLVKEVWGSDAMEDRRTTVQGYRWRSCRLEITSRQRVQSTCAAVAARRHGKPPVDLHTSRLSLTCYMSNVKLSHSSAPHRLRRLRRNIW